MNQESPQGWLINLLKKSFGSSAGSEALEQALSTSEQHLVISPEPSAGITHI